MITEKERVVSLFGEAIKLKRMEMHLSQRDVAQLTGITHVHIGHIERGMKEPSITIALRLCDTLDIDINDLIATLKTP